MLSEKEKKEIDEGMEAFAVKRASGVNALKAVQKYRGWISDDTLADIAAYLEESEAALDNIATFYNFIYRKPVGRHVIHVCDGISCWIMKGESIAAYILKKLGTVFGEISSGGKFTVLPNSCLGLCEQAPAMLIDEDVYTNLTVEKIDIILEKYE